MGINLIPFTIQKQNLVTSMLSHLLASAEVWQLRCMEVNQTSPGSPEGATNVSTAELSYVMQQRTSAASFVGEVSNEDCSCACKNGLTNCKHTTGRHTKGKPTTGKHTKGNHTTGKHKASIGQSSGRHKANIRRVCKAAHNR